MVPIPKKGKSECFKFCGTKEVCLKGLARHEL